jgi:hypothetical protein
MHLFTSYSLRIKARIKGFIRKATARQRTLPNCLILGAQKAGTSSLYHYLIQHPQAHQSLKKEVHFFSGGLQENIDTYEKGERWYRAHFPLQSTMKVGDIAIDATPMYLFHPQAPARINAMLPNAKLIILLRNPVERAISHYFHVQRHGFEPLTIAQAFADENSRLQKISASSHFKDPAYRLFSYQQRGLYLAQIKRYQTLFPAEQILIMNSDELFQQPQQSLKKVFCFLGIDDNYQIPDLQSQNVGNNKAHVPENTYQQLQEFFEQPNKDLFEHINQKFPW